jgi:hypothetical protein
VMLPLNLVHHLGQAVLHIPQGHLSIYTHSHKCSYIRLSVKILFCRSAGDLLTA